MKFHYFLICSCSIFYLLLNGIEIQSAPSKDDPTLKLVYVVFRHGNRTPNGPEEVYPKDPYGSEKYPLVGIGQLTDAGKKQEYSIGKRLRERYNNFLGPYYTPDLIEPFSSDYNRTKMSLLLVLAGLFPPRAEQIWNEHMNWQPIPYNYVPVSEDKILMGHLCPHYLKLYDQYIATPKVQARFEKYKDIFAYISFHSGLNVKTFQDVYNLYFGLKAEEDYGFKLPEWTTKVWPDTITNLAVAEYFIATGTKNLLRMASGYLIQKIIDDMTLLINGTNTERKIYLVSAHELNIATLLITLGFNPNSIPNYGAYVTLELHKRDGRYEIMIYYENYMKNKPMIIKLRNCGVSCSFDTFKSQMQQYLPPYPNFCSEN